MTRASHTCAGCRAELRVREDMEKVPGDVYSSWRCSYCKTPIDGMVAEKLKHQRR